MAEEPHYSLQWRQVWPHKPGCRVWVTSEGSQQSKPDWLPEREPCTYLGQDPETPVRAILRTDAGREVALNHNQYEGPYLVLVGKRWLPETDPEAQAEIRLQIERQSVPGQEAMEHYRLKHLSHLRWVLERAGT